MAISRLAKCGKGKCRILIVDDHPIVRRGLTDLLSREPDMEVFAMLGQGMTTREIARRLDLSPKTVETHRENIKTKLDLKNSCELSRRAVLWALEHT